MLLCELPPVELVNNQGCSVESLEEHETDNMYMENSDEDICSSDLTTCVHDTETASGTENKMEEPPPSPPALMMLLQNIMDNTSTVHEQTKLKF